MGHNDIICERANSFTVKCISQQGSMYVVKAEEFKTHMSKNEDVWNDVLRAVDELDEQYF